MDEFEEINSQLPPHKYPAWVLAFGFIVLLVSIYSLLLLPKYLLASIKLKTGQTAYRNQNYPEAIQLYQQVLQEVPSSKEAKISIAEAYFSSPNPEAKKLGLIYLQDLELRRVQRWRLERAIPPEYKQYLKKFKD